MRAGCHAIDVGAGRVQRSVFPFVRLVGEPVDQFDHTRPHGAPCFNAHAKVVDVGRTAEFRVLVREIILQLFGVRGRHSLSAVLSLWLHHGHVDGDQVAQGRADEHIHTTVRVSLLVDVPLDLRVHDVPAVPCEVGKGLHHVVVPPCVPAGSGTVEKVVLCHRRPR
jgi:hypothetical protein